MRFPFVVALLAVAAMPFSGDCESAPAASSATLETLRRLKGIDLDANAAIRSVLLRTLESFRGTPEFVELVRDFDLSGQESGLLEVARSAEDPSAGAEAIRLLIQQDPAGAPDRIRVALRDCPPTNAVLLVRAVAAVAQEGVLPVLAGVLTESATPAEVRSAAIRGLAQNLSGATLLLDMAEAGDLDDAARLTAGLALASARWPAIRARAARVTPAPSAGDGAPLPPVARLLEMRGDPDRGARVFRSEKAGCIRCHAIGGEGIDFGPGLSQIGTKLGRQALYEAILDPNAGISFGYEGWTVQTQDGEEFDGLLVSETPEAIAIRQQSGVVVEIPRDRILSRHRHSLSLMPSGLAAALTKEELVDLVEYLATLKAPE